MVRACRGWRGDRMKTGPRLSAESMVLLLPRIEAHIDRSAGAEGCHLWTGLQSRNGYGRIEVQYHNRKFRKIAHRLYYEIKVEVLEPQDEVDHLCRTRLCMNLRHMEPVTLRENTLRGYGPTAVNARKTHCIHGHIFDEGNTGRDSRGGRYCRACMNAGKREKRRRIGSPPLVRSSVAAS